MPNDRDLLEQAISGVRAGTAMPRWRPSVAPAYVYLLADNLDAALAAGEDLLTASFYWLGAGGRGATSSPDDRLDTRGAVEVVRRLEATLVARVLKSRERAEEIGKRETRFRPIARLYAAGTGPLVEAVVEFGDTSRNDFETGGGLVSYLRTRGLIAADAPAPDEGQRIAISEELLIARRIRLGTLMDLVAMFLDTLEAEYEIYVEAETPDAGDEPPDDEVAAALEVTRAASETSPDGAAET